MITASSAWTSFQPRHARLHATTASSEPCSYDSIWGVKRCTMAPKRPRLLGGDAEKLRKRPWEDNRDPGLSDDAKRRGGILRSSSVVTITAGRLSGLTDTRGDVHDERPPAPRPPVFQGRRPTVCVADAASRSDSCIWNRRPLLSAKRQRTSPSVQPHEANSARLTRTPSLARSTASRRQPRLTPAMSAVDPRTTCNTSMGARMLSRPDASGSRPSVSP